MPTEDQAAAGHPSDQPSSGDSNLSIDLSSTTSMLDALAGRKPAAQQQAKADTDQPTGSDPADKGGDSDEADGDDEAGDPDGEHELEDEEDRKGDSREERDRKAAVRKMHEVIRESKERDELYRAAINELADRLERLEGGAKSDKDEPAPKRSAKVDPLKAARAIREADTNEEAAEALQDLLASMGSVVDESVGRAGYVREDKVEEIVEKRLRESEIRNAGGAEAYQLREARKYARNELALTDEQAGMVATEAMKIAKAAGENPNPKHVFKAAMRLAEGKLAKPDAKPAPKPQRNIPPGQTAPRRAAPTPSPLDKLKPAPGFRDRFKPAPRRSGS